MVSLILIKWHIRIKRNIICLKAEIDATNTIYRVDRVIQPLRSILIRSILAAILKVILHVLDIISI